MTTAAEIKAPITHEGDKPEDLVGQSVLVRPYYHVPETRSCLRAVRSPFTTNAVVIETFGQEMVKVRFMWAVDSAPWREESVFYPKELHKTGGWFPICECAACKGDGIHEHSGA
ncbi:hypothetical protein [Streptomyces sp. NPDC001422]|uniref:hypothetical protein n=1 Tax=Streptomyces sp. NPDC001422 TaxID=3364575 RepID=UPI0036ABF93E